MFANTAEKRYSRPMFYNPSCKISWAEYKERAEAAARRSRRGSGTIANLSPDLPQLWPIHQGRQCIFISKSLGRQCKNWAVKGAKRCNRHGGLREAPDHPANGRMWLKGLISDKDNARAAIKANNTHPKVKEVVEMLRSMGIVAKPLTLKAALDALDINDNGKAWRRFIKSAPRKRKRKAEMTDNGDFA